MNGSPMDRVDYQTEPSRYKHWELKFDGPMATLIADFDENAGLRPGYKLQPARYSLRTNLFASSRLVNLSCSGSHFKR